MTDLELSESDLLDRALAVGEIRVPGTEKDSISLRHRLNRQRSRSRKVVEAAYGPGYPSPYDVLTLVLDGGDLIIRHRPKIRVVTTERSVAVAETVGGVLTEPPLARTSSGLMLCEWCGEPSDGPFCCEEHEGLAEAKTKAVISQGSLV